MQMDARKMMHPLKSWVRVNELNFIVIALIKNFYKITDYNVKDNVDY